jgi:hypothetical protein
MASPCPLALAIVSFLNLQSHPWLVWDRGQLGTEVTQAWNCDIQRFLGPGFHLGDIRALVSNNSFSMKEKNCPGTLELADFAGNSLKTDSSPRV